MKKFVSGFLVGAVLATSISAFAINANLLLNSIKVKVNGKDVAAENIVYNDRTYVPLRAIGEILGKDIIWDEATKTAHVNDKSDVSKSEPNQEVISKIDAYLLDIETQTNRKIPQTQKDLIINYVKTNPVQKLSADEITLARKDFDSKREHQYWRNGLLKLDSFGQLIPKM